VLTPRLARTLTGTELTTAPAYGSLLSRFGKPAAGLVLPTIVIVGILYSLVVSRAIFFQIFKEGSRHRSSHTVKGWATWFLIVFVGWAISFIIGEAVPFFSDLLSLISSLFSSVRSPRAVSSDTDSHSLSTPTIGTTDLTPCKLRSTLATPCGPPRGGR